MLITLLVLKVRDDKQHGGVATFIMTRFLATIYAFEESLAPKRVKKKKKGSSFLFQRVPLLLVIRRYSVAVGIL